MPLQQYLDKGHIFNYDGHRFCKSQAVLVYKIISGTGDLSNIGLYVVPQSL